MDEPDEVAARRLLGGNDDDVVAEPWEERLEVVEAGLDDNTAPQPDPRATPTAVPPVPPPPGTSIGEGPAATR